VRLAALCSLETVPTRIEAFDISNFGDEAITAGMVVFENAKPKKSDYRLFSIKSTDKRDDYASMREAVRRRLSHLADEGAKLPDLILIDGGENHRAIAAEEVALAGYAIPVFGMVKDDFHKTRALIGEDGEISIATEQSVYTLIYNIQEEVHRFTISKMTAKKRKSQTTSVLEKIDGIGEAKAKALLLHFGGLSAIKKATAAELCAVRGITETIANNIIEHFQKERK
jgi:excinuclease ABC subunit C